MAELFLAVAGANSLLTGAGTFGSRRSKTQYKSSKKAMSPGKALFAAATRTGAGAVPSSEEEDHWGKVNPLLADGDVIAIYESNRGLYWTCESSTLGGGHAIKMLARGDELSKANTFTVMMVPQVFGRKKDARQIFCLRSLHNGHLVSPNFRGRFHVNGVCTDGTLHRQENQFSVVHKTKKIKKKKGGPPGAKPSYKKLPVARFWHHQYNQWLYTHDSKVHRTPRIAMCGDAQHIGQATHYKFIWVSRGVTRRAKEEDLSAAAAAPSSPPPPPPSAAAAAVAAGGL